MYVYVSVGEKTSKKMCFEIRRCNSSACIMDQFDGHFVDVATTLVEWYSYIIT